MYEYFHPTNWTMQNMLSKLAAIAYGYQINFIPIRNLHQLRERPGTMVSQKEAMFVKCRL